MVKVKSHQNVSDIADPAAQWLALGNMAADQACKQALANDLSVVHEMVQSAVQTRAEERRLLQGVYAYLLHLHRVTGQRLTQPEEANPASAADSLNLSRRSGMVTVEKPSCANRSVADTAQTCFQGKHVGHTLRMGGLGLDPNSSMVR